MRKQQADLRQRILEIATPLFIEQGYDKVDMRSLARELNIAVGTLYNYYPNKRVLFFEAFEAGWERVFVKTEQICSMDKPAKVRIKLFLQEFFQAIIERSGLGNDLLKLSFEAPEEQSRIRQVQHRLRQQLAQVISETTVEQEQSYFFAKSLLLSTWSMAKEQPEDGQLHFAYIDWLLARVFKEKECK